MNFPDGLFSNAWAYGAILPYALFLLWAAIWAPWRRLADSRQMNVWMGTIVVLMLVWSLKAGVKPGLNLHMLGATAFTLMFGRQLALLGLSVVLAAVTYNASLKGIQGWQPFALNALALVVFPVFVTYAILRFVERRLPAHIFVYIFVAAFFGAAVTVVATGMLTALMLWLVRRLCRRTAAVRLRALLHPARFFRSLAQWRCHHADGGVLPALGRQFRRPALPLAEKVKLALP